MKSSISLFKQVLQKYRFESPIPDEIQQFITSVKRRVLVDIFKSAGDYSFFYGFALRIFFGVKKLGFSISFLQSIVFLVISSFLITAAVAASIILTVMPDKKLEIDSPIKINTEKIESERASLQKTKIKPKIQIGKYQTEFLLEKDKDNEKNRKNDTPAKYILGIQPFLAENIDEKTAKSIRNRIASNLVDIMGNKNVIQIRKDSPHNVNIMVLGSVGRLGDIYIISAKLVDVNNSRIIFITSENIRSTDEFDNVCMVIARRLSKMVR